MGTRTEREVAAQAAEWAKVRDGLPTTHQGVMDAMAAVRQSFGLAYEALSDEREARLAPLRASCGSIGHIFPPLTAGGFIPILVEQSPYRCVICGAERPRGGDGNRD